MNKEYGIRPASQPYVCANCGANFNTRGGLFEHKKLMCSAHRW